MASHTGQKIFVYRTGFEPSTTRWSCEDVGPVKTLVKKISWVRILLGSET